MTTISPPPDAASAAAPARVSKPARSPWATAAQFSYLGIFFGVAVAIGAFGGRYIERRWGGAPWVSLSGMLVGVAAGFRESIGSHVSTRDRGSVVIDRERLRSIERWTMLLGALITIASFLLGGREWGLSVSLGAGIMIANTFATRIVSNKLWQSLRPDATATKGQAVRAVVLFNMKMAGVLLAIYLVIHYLHVNAIGLVLGLSVYPLGAVMSTLLDPPRENGAPLEGQHG